MIVVVRCAWWALVVGLLSWQLAQVAEAPQAGEFTVVPVPSLWQAEVEQVP